MNHSANNQQAALARREELVVQELPDEVLVYDLRQHKAHCLNHTAAFVWNHCDGQKTAAEMAGLIEKKWGKPVSEDVVWLALQQLSKADLLKEEVVRSAGGVNLSRRAAVRRLGLATALALPLVTSIVSPAAAASASIPVICQSCVKKIGQNFPCPQECLDVVGECSDNAGCGGGGHISCETCGTCGNIHGGSTTASWHAPGSC